MKKLFNASVGLVSIILLMGILSVIFLAKDRWLNTEKITQYYYSDYLTKKFQLVDYLHQDKNALCNLYKKEKVEIEISGMIYQLFCKNINIFKIEPTKKKYVPFNDIQQYLDIEHYQEQIIHIQSLKDLPKTSSRHPSVVIADNAIDESLKKNFYGIIITDYHFDIKGKKFYGKLYSSYDNEREERNLSYKKSVIKYLKSKYGAWFYIPNSQNLLNGKK
ncbi:DUF2572 family protein [Pasteurella atlantica]|uniref:DUF2572 family protein n=1 Tax=Pasteurellaceae TaxID=712 RepID=UPI002760CF39|nr:DUF2572 family protein [Pasteurella atlantica]MDP8033744.1 DUF2572 family protein [Pasteurella atlantica]MDP8035679.1 DUF2572 family protein [Pasteurella atlantica]MDP8037640.1 DUF2572 family protein [Pasteurella atlantica]MDP8047979.1 DUF2572 family protein [Pasteurella atlantica]MDP8049934.1 DUF2572 family protein [Pasteurella atlantica]